MLALKVVSRSLWWTGAAPHSRRRDVRTHYHPAVTFRNTFIMHVQASDDGRVRYRRLAVMPGGEVFRGNSGRKQLLITTRLLRSRVILSHQFSADGCCSKSICHSRTLFLHAGLQPDLRHLDE
jgi:hypothetical protein